MKMAQMTNDFEVVSQFQPLNHTDPHLVEEMVSYFQVAETIHWSLFTMGLVLTLCIVILICFCSYLKCPSFMTKILACCWSQKCCLLKCLHKRVNDNEILRAQMSNSDPEESVQMIDMSQTWNPNQPRNENVSPNTITHMITPTRGAQK